MKVWVNIFRGLIFLVLVLVLAVEAQLYLACKGLRSEINTMNNDQKADAQVVSNRFKDQQQEIVRLREDLEDTTRQIKDLNDALSRQKDSLLQEIEKRQQIENESRNIRTSVVDLRAEADAIKQDMKGWQKDYVAVLAQLEKKIEDSGHALKQNIVSLQTAIEKMTHPQDNVSR